MPSVRFLDNNFPEKSKDIFYEFGDEKLEFLVSKYDIYSTPTNVRCAIGANVILTGACRS